MQSSSPFRPNHNLIFALIAERLRLVLASADIVYELGCVFFVFEFSGIGTTAWLRQTADKIRQSSIRKCGASAAAVHSVRVVAYVIVQNFDPPTYQARIF
jgi:hypothetical protein